MVITVNPGQELTIGPVTGTLAGVPAPLPDSVVFVPSGDLVLTPVDAVTVVCAVPIGAVPGVGQVVVSCGTLAPVTVEILVPAPPVADTLVVPVGDVRSS